MNFSLVIITLTIMKLASDQFATSSAADGFSVSFDANVSVGITSSTNLKVVAEMSRLVIKIFKNIGAQSCFLRHTAVQGGPRGIRIANFDALPSSAQK